MDRFVEGAYRALMARQKNYIRAWREHRDMTLEGVAEAFGMTHQNVGRIERGKVPYTPEFLETAARLYRCTKGNLLEDDPKDQRVRTMDMLRQLTPDQLRMLQAQIKGLVGAA